MQQLQPGTTLQGGKYKIERVLGQGGFGITYLALNTMLDGKVAIKEFFFKEYCDRDESTSHVTVGTSSNHDIVERFKQKFIKEAKTLFRLNHPNIVRILDIFEENATAYYVMEYIEGESLGDMVKRRGAIPEAEALGYIREVGSALSYIHSEKMNHLDIKPNNLVKRNKDGQVLVIDFGVAKQYDAQTSEGTTTTPVGISHGYSPAEQYRKNGVQTFSPQSDVYALAATLYKLLTGITPPEAMEIQDEGLPVDELNAHGVSSAVTSAIVAAMRSRSVRTHSVEAFVADLAATDEEDIEATVLTPANQLAEAKAKEEAERKAREEAERQRQAQQEVERKRAEAMAAKEKAAAQAKAEAERKAREEAEQKRRETERQQQSTGPKKNWIAIVIGLLVVAGIAIFLSSKNADTSTDAQEIVELPTEVENATIVLTKGHESKRNFVYTGQVDEEGLPHGEGTAQYPETKSSGSCTFTGTFEHGITSQGEMKFSSGTKFNGTFNADGYFKEGTWTEKDGYYFKGTFKNGDPYNGTWYTPQGQQDGKVVNGK